MDEPTDAEVEARLAAQPSELWDELFTTVEALDHADRHPAWAGGRQVDTHVDADGVEHPVFQVGFPEYSPRVERLRDLWGRLGLVIRFDWSTWHRQHPYPQGAGLEAAPVTHAARLLTAIARAERFGDGAIATALSDGTVDAIHRRLLAWHRDR